MSHYWTADDPIESRREQIIDWIDDLVEFGAGIVASACQEWRRSHDRRPTPADIRRLCIGIEEMRRQSATHRQLPTHAEQQAIAAARIEDRQRENARYEHARRVREATAAELGYPSFSYMLSIGLVNAVRNAPGRRDAAPTAADLGVTATESAA